ncbi:MAG: hypothetical protein LAQ30_31290, partial [Acidobacteriia bacterium]|nr:hypothetical protein [Terriglobia bacterium]
YMPGQQPMPGTVYPGGRQPMPGMPGMPGTQGAAAGQQPAGGGSAPYISAYPGLGSQPTTPTTSQPIPGMPGTQGVPLPGVPPGVVINPQTGQPVQAGPSAFPGASPGGQNPATQMIQNILTNPNPRGMATVQGQQQGAGSAGGVGFGSGGGVVTGAGGAGGTIGGGVAGVASGAEMEGIMVYNDRTAYNEWEFVFDPSKIPPMPRLGGSSMGGTPANQMGTPAGQLGQQQQQQTTAFGQPSPFGQPAGGAGASRGGIMPGAQQGGVQPGQQGGMQPGGFGMGQGGQIQIRMGRP